MSPDFFASAADVGPLGTLPLTDAVPDDAEVLAGEYVLLELVGRGGSGEVYRALQLSTRREVAVKRLRAGRSDARFDQEVQVLSLGTGSGSGFWPFRAVRLFSGEYPARCAGLRSDSPFRPE